MLVGPNGAGKSTLLKLLAEVLKPQSGALKHGHNTKSGYFAQHRAAMLNPKHTVLQEALDTPQRVTEQAVRNVLGSFLFRGDDVFKPVSVLSGGGDRTPASLAACSIAFDRRHKHLLVSFEPDGVCTVPLASLTHCSPAE